MKWQRGTVDLSIGIGGRTGKSDLETRIETVQADISGPFAIHAGPHGYRVTHLATGRYIASRLPTKAKAKALCDQISDLIDWDTATPDEEPLPEIKRALIAAIEEARW